MWYYAGEILQCWHSGYKELLQLPRESMNTFFFVCCLSELEAEMPRYQLYTHEKNGMSQFTNHYVSIAIYCLQQSKFISAIHKTKKDSCCKRAISWRYQRMRSSLKRLLGICMSLLNLYKKSRWRLHKFLCNKITPSSKDKMCHCKRLKNQWGKDSI